MSIKMDILLSKTLRPMNPKLNPRNFPKWMRSALTAYLPDSGNVQLRKKSVSLTSSGPLIPTIMGSSPEKSGTAILTKYSSSLKFKKKTCSNS
jgi:hypothetical protein